MAAAASLPVAHLGLPDAPEHCLSVDGMGPRGPNLSHWPGNRTPRAWKADLTTGICLAFARAPAAARQAFLSGAQAVANDHYDTDGFLSMLAVLRPDVALAREAQCLAAAATGDYRVVTTEQGFATDRIVQQLMRSAASPIAAELATRRGAARELLGYRWLLEHAETVLDEPQALASLWRADWEHVREQLARATAGAIVRRAVAEADLAVLRGPGSADRIVLNTIAGNAFRVLQVIDGDAGPLYRYHDRTESWFEVVTFRPPARRDLRPLGDRLQLLEDRAGGAAAGQWCADPPGEPVPELYHGMPAAQQYGEVTRELTPSRLSVEVVEQAVAAHLRRP
ncbi:MAG: DUF6687 family protein [Planctomycetota bacterium]